MVAAQWLLDSRYCSSCVQKFTFGGLKLQMAITSLYFDMAGNTPFHMYVPQDWLAKKLSSATHLFVCSPLESMKVKVRSLSRVWLFATPWTVAHQAPPSMGFSGKNTGVGFHFFAQINPHFTFLTSLSCFWILSAMRQEPFLHVNRSRWQVRNF